VHPQVGGVGHLVAEHVVLLVVAPHQHNAAARAGVAPERCLPAACCRSSPTAAAAAAGRLFRGLATLGGRLGCEPRLGRRPYRARLDELVLHLAQRGEVGVLPVLGQLGDLGLHLPRD
jgi:hypothetical protein